MEEEERENQTRTGMKCRGKEGRKGGKEKWIKKKERIRREQE